MKARTIIAAVLNFIIRAGILIVVVICIRKLCLAAYDYGYRIYSEPPMATGEGIDIVVDIPEGSSVKDTGKLLKEYGLIRDDKLFYMQELLSDYHGKLEPGVYSLNTAMNAEEMMKAMSPSVAGEGEEDSDSQAAAAASSDADTTAGVTPNDVFAEGSDGNGEADAEGMVAAGEEGADAAGEDGQQ